MKPDDVALTQALLKAGWTETKTQAWSFEKGDWRVVYDTSSWLEVGTLQTPRIFDVPVPREGLETWTVNLIEHLCRSNDDVTQKLPQHTS